MSLVMGRAWTSRLRPATSTSSRARGDPSSLCLVNICAVIPWTDLELLQRRALPRISGRIPAIPDAVTDYILLLIILANLRFSIGLMRLAEVKGPHLGVRGLILDGMSILSATRPVDLPNVAAVTPNPPLARPWKAIVLLTSVGVVLAVAIM